MEEPNGREREEKKEVFMNRDILAASIERRDHPRRNVLGNITLYHLNTERAYEGKILDISQHGLSCATDMSLNILSPVKVLVNKSTDLHHDTTFTGKVIWAMNMDDLNSGKYRYGIKFETNA